MAHLITGVEKNSPLLGKVSPGDWLVSVNGHDITDVLDYKFRAYDAKLDLVFETPAGKQLKLRVKKDEGEELGLSFGTYLMDRAKGCSNRCVFCFVDQLPRGLRKTLYFKDDDARLSFLTGNYITLTNLGEEEIERICRLKISPINISVHATEPELRARLLGNPKGADGFAIMQRLAGARITMQCQIVCCPGENDGEALKRTMTDLASLYPWVESVSVVPVGLTRYRENLAPLAPVDGPAARRIVADVESFAADCLARLGSRVFFCADEFYLKAELPLPEDEAYEGYPQLENGVGMLRLLETEFLDALEDADCAKKGQNRVFSTATGVSAAPFIEKLMLTAAKKCDTITGRVFAVQNDFFGLSIDVAGLLTGGDLIAQLKGRELGQRLLIPRNMLRHGETVFLDDVTLRELEEALGVSVRVVEQSGSDLLAAMLE